MNPAPEIVRLRDLLPASWRMSTKINNQRDRQQVIASTPIKPWNGSVEVSIQFGLWADLPVDQRDLLFLREVAWRHGSNWFKLETYQILTLVTAVFTIPEIVQFDPAGMSIGFLLTTVAVNRVVKHSRSTKVQLEADNEAIAVAQRRGYSEAAAAKSLLDAIKTVARLEGRSTPEFEELIRCQNLRAVAGLSSVAVPTNRE